MQPENQNNDGWAPELQTLQLVPVDITLSVEKGQLRVVYGVYAPPNQKTGFDGGNIAGGDTLLLAGDLPDDVRDAILKVIQGVTKVINTHIGFQEAEKEETFLAEHDEDL